jgi:pilus assembly protein Flp/PilA
MWIAAASSVKAPERISIARYQPGFVLADVGERPKAVHLQLEDEVRALASRACTVCSIRIEIANNSPGTREAVLYAFGRPSSPHPLTGIKAGEVNALALLLALWRDKRGQDLIEYALMASFGAVAAGATMPSVASSISTVFSQISSVMAVAASQS